MKITLYLDYLYYKYGPLLLIGIILNIVALILCFLLTIPSFNHIDDVNKVAREKRINYEHVQEVSLGSGLNAITDVFYKKIPPEGDVPKLLEEFFDIAFSNNIYLRNIEYGEDNISAANLLRCRISFPVEGSYIEVRKFSNQLLTEFPFVSLDNLSFNRESKLDTYVNVKMQISFYVDKSGAL